MLLNLILNAIEAMSAVNEGPRELLISSASNAVDSVLVAVRDSGPGLTPESFDRLFHAFHTTKPDGMGMGLIDLPFDRRGARRTAMGHGQRPARCCLSVHTACAPGEHVVSMLQVCTSRRRPRHRCIDRRSARFQKRKRSPAVVAMLLRWRKPLASPP